MFGCYLVDCFWVDNQIFVEVVLVLQCVFKKIGYCGQFDMWVWMYIDIFVGCELCWVYLVEKDEWIDEVLFGCWQDLVY